MEILLINGSPRKDGNTEIMADVFLDGVRQNGHTAAKINLCDKDVCPCIACGYCFSHEGVCAQEDDMTAIYAALKKADMIVFASPIYYFGMTAQILAVIDRFYAVFRVGHHPKSCALLLDSCSPGVFTGATAQYKDIVSFLKWEDRGIITISGMNEKGAMRRSPELKKVREFALGLGPAEEPEKERCQK